ncbi:MAG: DUF5610 domain-containing protein [Fibrobacter sp.]|nr:DUF5610 domain-containing protein [Fibrobacter sp.]
MVAQGIANRNISGITRSLYPNSNANQSRKNSFNAQVYSESTSFKAVSFDGRSKDGDDVFFSIQSVEFQKQLLKIEAEGDSDSIKSLVSFIKDQLKNLSRGIIPDSVGHRGVKKDSVTGVSDDFQIPEYWNAENTSQRIVDFSLSFFEVSGMGDEKFLQTIKAAIDEGFKQAKQMLGELPENISKLNNDTYELVMAKLDAWISKRNEAVTQDQAENV